MQKCIYFNQCLKNMTSNFNARVFTYLHVKISILSLNYTTTNLSYKISEILPDMILRKVDWDDSNMWKDDTDQIKLEWWKWKKLKPRGRPRKTWWDSIREDMKRSGLSQEDVQSRRKWRRKIEELPANPVSRHVSQCYSILRHVTAPRDIQGAAK